MAQTARRRARDRARYREFKLWLAQMKSIPCSDCGRKFPPYVMHFDHVRGKKVTEVSQLHHNKKRALAEMRKCELVCANCHIIRHWKRLHKET